MVKQLSKLFQIIVPIIVGIFIPVFMWFASQLATDIRSEFSDIKGDLGLIRADIKESKKECKENRQAVEFRVANLERECHGKTI